MRFAILLAILAISCLRLPAAAQTGSSGLPEDPVEVLLDLRRQLDLTRSQVGALREIQSRLQETNRPLIQQVFAVQRRVRAELVGSSPDDFRRGRQPTRTELHAARIPMETILRNNLAAMEQVNAMLTDEQKRRAAVFLRIRDGRSDRRSHRPIFPG